MAVTRIDKIASPTSCLPYIEPLSQVVLLLGVVFFKSRSITRRSCKISIVNL
jgi:hypothetical protein